MSDIVRFLSKVAIGIGLTYSSMIFMWILGSIFTLNNVTGSIACIGLFLSVLAFAIIYARKKSFKFDRSLISKVCLGAFLSVFFTFGVYFIFPIGGLVPLLFAASGFFAVGFVGVYGERKYRQLGFCFLILSLLFLVGAPLVNLLRFPVGYDTEINPIMYLPVNKEYTLPLILVSIAFFILGSELVLYNKFQKLKKQNLDNTQIFEKKTEEPSSSFYNQTKTSKAKKITANLKGLGFSFMVVSPLILVWAAIVYRSQGVFRGTVPVILNYVDYALPLALIGVVVFALGFGLMLYKKSTRFGFFLIASGAIVLTIAAFTYAYETEYREYVPIIYHINPYRDFTLPLILASLGPFVLGYILMLKKRAIAY